MSDVSSPFRGHNMEGDYFKMDSKISENFLKENLVDLKSKGLYNVIDPLESSNGPIIKISGKEIIGKISMATKGVIVYFD